MPHKAIAGLVSLLLLSGTAFSSAAADANRSPLRVQPAEIRLDAPESTEQLLVFGSDAGGRQIDLTRSVNFSITDATVVTVSETGRIVPLRDGRTELLVKYEGEVARVPVVVQGLTSPAEVSFQRDILPILTKAGCNSGGCHGKAEGQNGFKLSVFGYDPAADHRAIVHEGRGRRVFPAAPDESLLLRKATAEVPHGGGHKVAPGSLWYRRLRRWIAEGAQLDQQVSDPVTSVHVEPAEVTLAANASQQLRVVATHENGLQRSVTVEAEFETNNEAIAGVDRDGLVVATDVPGEAAVLVRYLGHVAVCRITRPRSSGEFARPEERNFIDRLVWNKLEALNVPPSVPADDATFLRRVFLDTIGTLPTAEEVRAFLQDASPDKRSRLITRLLDRPEYAIYWAQRWSDLLQVDKDIVTPQGAVAMSRWLRGQFQRNIAYDEFVRTILTARGSTLRESPAAFFQVQADPEQLARSVSQLFLGVRIECAQCHHHPFERWDQPDYYAFAGFFTGIDRTAAPFGGVKIVDKEGIDLKHPRSGQPVPTAGLGAEPFDASGSGDRRQAVADWVTSPDNQYFTRTIVNRLWAHYFGRGLVEPIDDLRATNPASNEALMEALEEHLIALDYDLKAFTQALLESQVYQLSSVALESNQLDEQNYSHAAWKPLPAEVLLDAVSQATGVPHEFNGWPLGYRAIEIWDNKLPSHFLEVFGRPTRQSVCACERNSEPSIAQALHLMNSPTTIGKLLDPGGRAARLAASDRSPDAIIEELYLATLSRLPSEPERQLMRDAFARAENRRTATEDVLWTLLNTKEFVFNH